jgi:hypothetical protein
VNALAPQHLKGFFGILDGPILFVFNWAQKPLFERDTGFKNTTV